MDQQNNDDFTKSVEEFETNPNIESSAELEKRKKSLYKKFLQSSLVIKSYFITTFFNLIIIIILIISLLLAIRDIRNSPELSGGGGGVGFGILAFLGFIALLCFILIINTVLLFFYKVIKDNINKKNIDQDKKNKSIDLLSSVIITMMYIVFIPSFLSILFYVFSSVFSIFLFISSIFYKM